MRCFIRRDVQAIGTCRACNKGICEACAVDLGHSICCQGSCEEKAKVINAQIAQSRTVFQTQRRSRFVAPAFFISMGVAFFLYAGTGKPGLNLGTVMGGGFVLFGSVLAIINQRYAKDLQKSA